VGTLNRLGFPLSPRWPGGEGGVRGADEVVGDSADLTLPSRSLSAGRAPRGPGGVGPLPLRPLGRRGVVQARRDDCH
jgi:hypothetical protein